MDTLNLLLLIIVLPASIIGFYALDKKYNLGLSDTGKEMNDFSNIDWFGTGESSASKPSDNIDKQQKIDELQQRIEVLERIVTDPGYDLKQQINKL